MGCAAGRGLCLLSERGSRIHRSERLSDGLAVSSKIAVPGEVGESDRVPLPVEDEQAAPPIGARARTVAQATCRAVQTH